MQLDEDKSEKIHFYNSILTAEDCFSISEKLKQNKSCTLLSLGNSQVDDEGIKQICEAIKVNNSLNDIKNVYSSLRIQNEPIATYETLLNDLKE